MFKPWLIPDKKIMNKGYAYVRIPEHPKATSTGYVYEHRVVAENKIERLLRDDEVVHHINLNKLDNRPENLVVLTEDQHRKVHGFLAQKRMVILQCPSCGEIFVREKRQTHLNKHGKLNATFCSNHCRGIMSRFIQLNGITPDVSLRLSSNVISEFTK